MCGILRQQALSDLEFWTGPVRFARSGRDLRFGVDAEQRDGWRISAKTAGCWIFPVWLLTVISGSCRKRRILGHYGGLFRGSW